MPFPFLAAIPVIGKIIEKGLGIVDQLVADKDLAEKLKAELQAQWMAADYSAFETEISKRAEIIVAEAKGESWLQRNWRPLLMLTTIAIVANNYIIHPYLALFGVPAAALELPDKMWNLLTLGVSGYVVGRSGEKIADIWKNGKKPEG